MKSELGWFASVARLAVTVTPVSVYAAADSNMLSMSPMLIARQASASRLASPLLMVSRMLMGISFAVL
jgi:hypothetical protein